MDRRHPPAAVAALPLILSKAEGGPRNIALIDALYGSL
jgi:hypothetical protein